MDVINKKTKNSKNKSSLIGLMGLVVIGTTFLIVSCSKPIEVVNRDEFDFVQVQHGDKKSASQDSHGNATHQKRDDISEVTYKAQHEYRTVKKENTLVEKLFDIVASSKKMAERDSSDLMNVMYIAESVKQIALKYQLTGMYEMSNWVSAHVAGTLIEEQKIDEKEYQEVTKGLEIATREQWKKHK